MSRHQIKYAMLKMMEDDVLKVKGKIEGARYSVVNRSADLRGDFLTNEVVNYLREKYEYNSLCSSSAFLYSQYKEKLNQPGKR